MSAVPTPTTTPRAEKDSWATPRDLFDRLSATHGPFDIDAAADATNHLCAAWFGPGNIYAEDALTTHWGMEECDDEDRVPLRVWVNPPYSRGMVGRFVAKAVEEARAGRAVTTLLIPAWTDQPWWAEVVWDAARGRFRPGVEVEFLRGRVRFVRPDGTRAGSPTFPSVVVTIGGVG